MFVVFSGSSKAFEKINTIFPFPFLVTTLNRLAKIGPWHQKLNSYLVSALNEPPPKKKRGQDSACQDTRELAESHERDLNVIEHSAKTKKPLLRFWAGAGEVSRQYGHENP